MDIKLGGAELRVLGCLIEKEFLTPDNYPMTVNYLRTSCNQKSSRCPVVEYDVNIVEQTLSQLRSRGLVTLRSGTGSRVLKYDHLLPSYFDVKIMHTSVLCVLMLRGPQTLGELKSRTCRMFPFEDTSQLEETLTELMERSIPLVAKLHRAPGQKECRYMHLLSAKSETTSQPTPLQFATSNPDVDSSELEIPHLQGNSEKGEIYERVAVLEKKISDLKNDFRDFKKQFEQ